MSEEIKQLERALACLVVEVDESIVADVSKKWDRVKAAIESLQQEYELTLQSETTLNAANEYKNTIIKDLKQENEQLQKCYKATNESWRKLAEENQRLKKILKQSHAALNRAEWLMAGVQITEDSGNKINKAIRAIEEGLK